MANSDNNKPSYISPLSNLGNSYGVSDYIIKDNYLYVACTTNNYIAIYDITSPTSPSYVKTIVDSTYLLNVSRIAIIGNYLYATANNSSTSGYLSIIDISDPPNASLAAHLIDATYLYPIRGLDSSGNYLFVITSTGSNNGRFSIYDTTSNPLNPTRVRSMTGTTSPNYLNYPLDIKVVGNYAYIVNYTSQRLCIFDVSDPSSAAIVGSVAPTSTLLRAVYVEGNYAYCCGESVNNGISIIDITDKANPTVIKEWTVGSSTTWYGIWADTANNLVYTAKYGYSTNSVQIWNIEDLDNVYQVNTFGPAYGGRLRYLGGRLYVASPNSSIKHGCSADVDVYKYSGLITTAADIHALEMDTMDRVDTWSVSAGNYVIAPIYRSDQLHVIAVDSSTKQIMGYGEVTPIISE